MIVNYPENGDETKQTKFMGYMHCAEKFKKLGLTCISRGN